MEIREWMKRPVQTVKPLDNVQHARDVMEAHRVKQLPVVVDGKLVGIITDRDLRDAFPSVFDTPLFGRRKARPSASDPAVVTVDMVMTRYVHTLAPGDSMAAAARLMRRERIGAVPIVGEERLVGIVTRSDVLDSFIELTDAEHGTAFSEAKAAVGAAPPSAARVQHRGR